MSGSTWIEALSLLAVAALFLPVVRSLMAEVRHIDEPDARATTPTSSTRSFDRNSRSGEFTGELARSNPAWHRGTRRRPTSAFDAPAARRRPGFGRGPVLGGTGRRPL